MGLSTKTLLKASFVSTVIGLSGYAVSAEEVVVRKAWLPFGLADLEQTLIFNPDEETYNSERDEALGKLRAGQSLNNPIEGAWVRIETTATVGIEIEGIGASSGHTTYRQITAAEDALFRFENE